MSGDADKRRGSELARGQKGGWICQRQKAQEGEEQRAGGPGPSEKRPHQQLLRLQKFEMGLFTNTNVGEE